MIRLKILIALFLAVLVFPARADYLIVSRSANVYKGPEKTSELLGTVSAGDKLFLLSTVQTNGYFHVEIPNSGIQGWVYRTLVRRYHDESGIRKKNTNSNSDSPPIAGESVRVRILDVGPAMCAVICLPDNKYIIYDAGDYSPKAKHAIRELKKIITTNEVEELIISHCDADHLYAADQILDSFRVKKIIHTGYDRSLCSKEKKSAAYTEMLNAIARTDVTEVNLHNSDSIIPAGTSATYGDAKLVYLCGFGSPQWKLSSSAEKINSVSIVVKLEYKGASVLFAGDALGRDPDSDNYASPIATEKYLVEKAGPFLKSDVLIAPHHGGNNSSSTAFIQKVSPGYVIFAAGHKYGHPTEAVAARYISNGVSADKIFRTDLGDDEGDRDETVYPEWGAGRISDNIDSYGDDNIEILIGSEGISSVGYVREK